MRIIVLFWLVEVLCLAAAIACGSKGDAAGAAWGVSVACYFAINRGIEQLERKDG